MTYQPNTNMQKDTAHQIPAKEKADEPLPLTPCSPLDLYATAALNGLLSNPTIIVSMGARAYIEGDADGVPAKIVEAAFHYAKSALKLREGIILENSRLSNPETPLS